MYKFPKPEKLIRKTVKIQKSVFFNLQMTDFILQKRLQFSQYFYKNILFLTDFRNYLEYNRTFSKTESSKVYILNTENKDRSEEDVWLGQSIIHDFTISGNDHLLITRLCEIPLIIVSLAKEWYFLYVEWTNKRQNATLSYFKLN